MKTISNKRRKWECRCTGYDFDEISDDYCIVDKNGLHRAFPSILRRTGRTAFAHAGVALETKFIHYRSSKCKICGGVLFRAVDHRDAGDAEDTRQRLHPRRRLRTGTAIWDELHWVRVPDVRR